MTKNVKLGDKVRIIAGDDATGSGFHRFAKGAVVEVIKTTGYGGITERITVEGAFVSGQINSQVLRHSDYELVVEGFKKGDRLEVQGSYGHVLEETIGRKGSIVTAFRDQEGVAVAVSVDGGKTQTAGGPIMAYRFKLAAPLAVPTLDTAKPLQTRTGEAVTLITTTGRGDYALVGYINGQDDVKTWKLNGAYYQEDESPLDLINVPEPEPVETTVIGWHNVYKNPSTGQLYMGTRNKTRAEADGNARTERVGVKKVVNVLTEGEFDD